MAADSGYSHTFAAATILLLGFFGYVASLAIYRLFLHPLKIVPGPKIAALTAWYEFYWDCLKHGQYFLKVQEMHKNYGPIVRINPWEVHINDPNFFENLYNRPKLDKDVWFYRSFGLDSTVGTTHWEQHKARRGAMAKFFSTANVLRMEDKVLSRVQKLLDRIEEHRQTGSVIDVSNAYRCYATDIVTDIAAPHTRDFLSAPDFAAAFSIQMRNFSSLLAWNRQFPFILPMMARIPDSIAVKMDPSGGTAAIVENQKSYMKQAKTVIETKGVPAEKDAPTILDAIYTSPALGPEDKQLSRLLVEAQNVIGAGTETTGNTLSNFTYHVIAQPSVMKRLKDELRGAAGRSQSSGLMDYRTLERLPYLKACVKEALRLATGVSSRIPRSSRTESITYRTPSGESYVFPPGTVISMSMLDLHYNEDIFVDAKSFRPERWLDNGKEKLQEMERAFVPFGRGSRQCVGSELAKEELTLMTGNLFYQFDLELFKTTAYDVQICYDFFAPWGPDDSKGIRVMAK